MTVLANNKLRLLVHRQCNADCFYCHNEGQPRSGSCLRPEDAGFVIDALHSYQVAVDEVTISGGEPLLHPRVTDIVALASRFGVPVTLVSNGLLVTGNALEDLARNGLNRLRLGLDSFRSAASEAPRIKVIERSRAADLICCARQNGLKVDLNVVITRYNGKQICSLTEFAVFHQISIKFFEHVAVRKQDRRSRLSLRSEPQVSYERFREMIDGCFGGKVNFRSDSQFGEANKVALIEKSEIRYCHYLCDHDLCWMSGTRIDPEGNTYVCMANHGVDVVSYDSPETVLQSLRTASARPCRYVPDR